MNVMTKEVLHADLAAARASTLAMIEAVDEAVRFRVPAGHTWSAVMVLDHLRILDEQVTAVVQRLATRAKKREAGPPPDTLTELKELSGYEEGVMDAPSVPGMEPRVPAPPTVIADAAAARARLVFASDDAWTADCREARFPHPWLGPMNAYEWLHFAAVHERGHHTHLRAILDIADADVGAAATER
jgi:hypothetical protein